MIVNAQRAWALFWFKRMRWHPLGLIRIVLAYRAIVRYIPQARGFAKKEIGIDSAHFFDNVGSTLTVFNYPMSASALPVMTYGLYVAALLAMVGLFTRTALAVLGLGLLYLFSGHAMRAGFNHQTAMIIQVFLILALAPGSKAWSLDRLIAIARFRFKRRHKPKTARGFSPLRMVRHMQGPAVPRWGLQLILALFVVVYTGAGVSKLRFSDYRWYDGQTLGYYLDGTHQAEKDLGQPFFADPEHADAYSWRDDAGLVNHSYGRYSHPIFSDPAQPRLGVRGPVDRDADTRARRAADLHGPGDPQPLLHQRVRHAREHRVRDEPRVQRVPHPDPDADELPRALAADHLAGAETDESQGTGRRGMRQVRAQPPRNTRGVEPSQPFHNRTPNSLLKTPEGPAPGRCPAAASPHGGGKTRQLL